MLIKNPSVRVLHLVRLLEVVSHLVQLGVLHGDICERNVCVMEDDEGSALVTVVDFGEIAPNCEGDVVACGRLLHWCEERLVWKDIEWNCIREAARILQLGDIALAVQEFQERLSIRQDSGKDDEQGKGGADDYEQSEASRGIRGIGGCWKMREEMYY
jgi:hypothetical protein